MWFAVRKTDFWASLRKMLKITEEEYWHDILRKQSSVINTQLISSKFFGLSNISASKNSLFTGCSVFDRFCLYFALLSLLVFCAVLLIKEQAEDGIRDSPEWLEFRRVLFRSGCPVFDIFCLYFALLSLLVFCAVLLIRSITQP